MRVGPNWPGWAPGGWAGLLLWVEEMMAKKPPPGDLQPGGVQVLPEERRNSLLCLSLWTTVAEADGQGFAETEA